MRGLILLGGDRPGAALLGARFAWADFVIAADGGLTAAMENELAPDVVVGDFDSGTEEGIAWARARGLQVRALPTRKDMTDGQAALDIALEAGCEHIALLGGFGGRFDHQFAHLCLLLRALKRGARAWMEDERQQVSCHGEGVVKIRGAIGDVVSILPFGDGLWVERLEGFRYPIPDRALPPDDPYGVSNVMTRETARIRIRGGVAVVIHGRMV